MSGDGDRCPVELCFHGDELVICIVAVQNRCDGLTLR